jgi:nucleoside-diphosphate-sugar epimerase
MRVLVTGGAGFIGSNLVERLVADGHAVRVLDNFSTGRHSNLASCRADVDLVRGDVRDRDELSRAVNGREAVFHHAALNSVPRSLENPDATFDTNARGTLELLRACARAGVRRVVYASSSSVYGASPHLPRRESAEALPLSPYAHSKLAGERHCDSVGDGPETVILRYFNVYGPRQDGLSRYAAVVPRFLAAARDGSDAVVFGSGDQSRDFTFVGDVVQANVLAMDAYRASGQRLNIATGRATTINELVEAVSEATGVDLESRYVSQRVGDVEHSVADVAVARAVLGHASTTSLADGLRLTVRSNADAAPMLA